MTFVVDTNVPTPARDGTILRCDVYRPDDRERHPVLLCRTPYGKESVALAAGMMIAPILTWAERGYAVVLQDVRGTGRSDGDFRFYVDDAADGVDVIAWCAAQPWSSGNVGMFGASYMSATQFVAAFERPPALKVLSPSVSPSFYYGDLAYRGGAFNLACGLEWSRDRVTSQQARAGATAMPAVDLPPAAAMMERMPLIDAPELSGSAGEHYHQWLEHPDLDTYWDQFSYAGRYDSIALPALHVAGWYDVFLGGTIANYLNLRTNAATQDARDRQRLVIGPWTHLNQSGRFDGRSFGPAAAAPAGLYEQQVDNFSQALTDTEPRQSPPGAPVRIFVMGVDEWRSESEWPLARTRFQALYLHSSPGGAPVGDLTFDPPGAEEVDSYVYDPADPVPTRGGQTLIGYELNEGPVDQRPNDSRTDVLTYQTAPLVNRLEVTGPVTLVAHVSASTLDTDLTGSLIDVHPDGRAELLTDGILRLRYRNSFREPEMLEPGAVYEVRVDLWATSNVFLPGHRLRLDVSSSNFPRYNRNTNTGGMIAHERADVAIPTTVQLHHDAAHPTHLLLPVIPDPVLDPADAAPA